MRLKTLIASTLGLLLGGCNLPQWQPGGTSYTSSTGDFSVLVPSGWMFVERTPGTIISTIDGTLLQRAAIKRYPLKEPLPNSKRTLSATLTPLELTEAMADDMRADRNFQELTIVKMEPATITGRAGCRLVAQFHTTDGLRVTEIVYGVIAGDQAYFVSFAAPTRYYYDRDLPGFEALVRSLVLKKA